MEDGDRSTKQEERKDRIAKLIQTISNKSKRKSDQQVHIPVLNKMNRKKDLKKINKIYKIHIGWLHYDIKKRRYKQVHGKNGGGTRIVEYVRDESESVETLIERGKKLFFPDGKSCHGLLTSMEISLSNYEGEEIRIFKNNNGESCSLQNYLKENGIFSSQFYIYLKTKSTLKDDMIINSQTDCNQNTISSSFGESKFLVNGAKPLTLDITYRKNMHSMYSGSAQYVTCHCMRSCFDLMYRNSLDFTSYNPFEDGYCMASIAVGGKLLFEKNEEGKNFYQEKEDIISLCDSVKILYSPHELFGIENSLYSKDLILAVIVTDPNPYIHWFRNDVEILAGVNACAIHISLPGNYSVGVTVGDKLYKIEPPVVITTCNDDEPYGDSKQEACIQSTDLNMAKSDKDKDFEETLKEAACSIDKEQLSLSKVSFEPVMKLESGQCSLSLSENISCSSTKLEVVDPIQENKEPEKVNNPNDSGVDVGIKSKMIVSSFSSVSASVSDEPQGQDSSVSKVAFSNILIGAMIGQGAFGTVYRASWLGTPVAVKEITVKRMKISRKMIERELTIHSKVRHPNILLLMGFTTNVNKLYLITELIEGVNLDDLLFGAESEEKTEVMPLATKFSVAQKVTRAVAYLHNQSNPIIHRDIKPENVLVSKDFSTVKLCDMGLSKLKTMDTIITTLGSSSSLQPGTPAYQAPEILLQKQQVTVYSDIWSLGCTLLELITEHPCWDNIGDNDIRAIYSNMQNLAQPDAIKCLPISDLPAQFIEMLIKSFDYIAKNRPDALQFLNAM